MTPDIIANLKRRTDEAEMRPLPSPSDLLVRLALLVGAIELDDPDPTSRRRFALDMAADLVRLAMHIDEADELGPVLVPFDRDEPRRVAELLARKPDAIVNRIEGGAWDGLLVPIHDAERAGLRRHEVLDAVEARLEETSEQAEAPNLVEVGLPRWTHVGEGLHLGHPRRLLASVRINGGGVWSVECWSQWRERGGKDSLFGTKALAVAHAIDIAEDMGIEVPWPDGVEGPPECAQPGQPALAEVLDEVRALVEPPTLRWEDDEDQQRTRHRLMLGRELVATIEQDEPRWRVEGHGPWAGHAGSSSGVYAAVARVIEIGVEKGVEVPPFYDAEGAVWTLELVAGEDALCLAIGGVETAAAWRNDDGGNAAVPLAWSGTGAARTIRVPDLRHAVGVIIARAASQGRGVEWPREWPPKPEGGADMSEADHRECCEPTRCEFHDPVCPVRQERAYSYTISGPDEPVAEVRERAEGAEGEWAETCGTAEPVEVRVLSVPVLPTSEVDEAAIDEFVAGRKLDTAARQQVLCDEYNATLTPSGRWAMFCDLIGGSVFAKGVPEWEEGGPLRVGFRLPRQTEEAGLDLVFGGGDRIREAVWQAYPEGTAIEVRPFEVPDPEAPALDTRHPYDRIADKQGRQAAEAVSREVEAAQPTPWADAQLGRTGPRE